MDPIVLFLLGGAALFFIAKSKGESKPTPGPGPGLPTPPSSNKCPYGGDKPIESLPDELRQPVLAALTVESDPNELETFAKAMDELCQPTAAGALRKKAALLRGAGVPPGGLPNVSVPSVEGTSPNPPTGVIVPPSSGPGLRNITPENVGAPPSPKSGFQSWPTQQWWTGPLKAGEMPWTFAKDVTGDGRRYIELIAANPEKKTVGDPANPFTTGFSFVSFKIGERVRIPRTWNIFIDQTGHYEDGVGKPLPVETGMPSLPNPIPGLSPAPGGLGGGGFPI